MGCSDALAGRALLVKPTRARTGRAATALLFAIILIALFAAWKLFGPSAATAGWYHDVEKGMNASESSAKPLLVLYTADWCPPCRQLKKDVLSDPDVSDFLREEFICVKVDLTNRSGDNNRVAYEFGVQSIPTIQVFNTDGRLVSSRTGTSPVPVFLNWLQRCRRRAG
ncbi:MAG: thioredoxin family protein [Planctomycetota bacterium]|jgi:protein disulfide-isomerase